MRSCGAWITDPDGVKKILKQSPPDGLLVYRQELICQGLMYAQLCSWTQVERLINDYRICTFIPEQK